MSKLFSARSIPVVKQTFEIYTMIKKTTCARLAQVINELDGQMSASETHGILVGILSLAPASPESVWQALILENLDCAKPTKKQWSVFTKVASKIIDEMHSQRFTFQLLLPDDEIELSERLSSLGNWCRGYLSGMAFVGLSARDLNNEVVDELVRDLSQISQVDSQSSGSEDDEHNYMELVEYVRIAVQNIQAELGASGTQQLVH